MANQKSPIRLRSILVIIVILLVLATAWFLVSSLSNSLNTALSPMRQANNMLSTQVAQLLHPTPTVIADPVTIINEINALARLETIQYSVEKVITAEVNQGLLGPLFGDRLLFVAHGIVIAGIDMSKITPQDMWLQDQVLNVRLPSAEIFTATLDNQKSYIYDRQTGLLTHGDVDLETTVRQVADEQIRQAALDDGILTLAYQNAVTYLSRLFLALGYPQVVFVQAASTPTP